MYLFNENVFDKYRFSIVINFFKYQINEVGILHTANIIAYLSGLPYESMEIYSSYCKLSYGNAAHNLDHSTHRRILASF